MSKWSPRNMASFMSTSLFIFLPFWKALWSFVWNDKYPTFLRDKYINFCYHSGYLLVIWLKNDKEGCLGVDGKQDRFLLTSERTEPCHRADELWLGSHSPKGCSLLGKLLTLSCCLHEYSRKMCLKGNTINVSFIWVLNFWFFKSASLILLNNIIIKEVK